MLLNILIIFFTSQTSSYAQTFVKAQPDLAESKLFSKIENIEMYTDTKEEVLVENMPIYKSQDGLPVCSGCATSVVIQKFICDTKKISNCADENLVKPDFSINSLAMFALATPINSDPKLNKQFTNYESLNFNSGGIGYNILITAMTDFSFYTEKCYAFDQFANRYGQNYTLMNTILSKLKTSYEKNKKQLISKLDSNEKITLTEANSECPDCLNNLKNQIQNDFFKTQDTEIILEGLSKNTFDEFLFTSLFGNCNTKSFKKPNSVEYFPKNNEDKVTRTQAIDKIKDILKKQKPIVADSLCSVVHKNNPKACIYSHALVISGYKEVCNKNKCKKLFKVHNCEGKDWQDQTGSWFDAETLLDQQIKETDKTVKINDSEYAIMENRNENTLMEQKRFSWLEY